MHIAGVDEVGRGPLAGPVVAAAVILCNTQATATNEHVIKGLADSKVLTAKRREALALEIKEKALAWSIAEVSVEDIDRLNIFHASLLAMRKAVEGLSIQPDKVLVDGKFIPPNLQINQVEAVIKGDAKVPAISAASVIAKVYRDKKMTNLAATYPHYGFAQHKGYPTKQHLAALHTYGPCAIHRKSFAPVKLFANKVIQS